MEFRRCAGLRACQRRRRCSRLRSRGAASASQKDVIALLQRAGGVPVGAEAAEMCRVEGGRPLFRVDMNEDTIPLEAGIEDRAISLTKGCYVGQEVIIRVLHRGHGRVVRKLVGIVLEPGAAVPSAGDKIRPRATRSARSPARSIRQPLDGQLGSATCIVISRNQARQSRGDTNRNSRNAAVCSHVDRGWPSSTEVNAAGGFLVQLIVIYRRQPSHGPGCFGDSVRPL